MPHHTESETHSPEPDPSYQDRRSPSGHIIEHHIHDSRWDECLNEHCHMLISGMLDIASERLKLSQLNLSVCWTNNHQMVSLNTMFRGKNNATNILTFPSDIPGEDGELVLSYEVVSDEAAQSAIDIHHHIIHLILHGVLHLNGYDHNEPAEAEQMERLETDILAEMNIADPHKGELI